MLVEQEDERWWVKDDDGILLGGPFLTEQFAELWASGYGAGTMHMINEGWKKEDPPEPEDRRVNRITREVLGGVMVRLIREAQEKGWL